jgi:DNA-binding HxlR family transcriptional regulator
VSILDAFPSTSLTGKERPIPPAPPPKRHPYDQWSPDARALDLVGDKWTLLIVRDLAGGPRRFVELQRTLPGISTEQLRSRLNRMVADGLLTRQRYREVPPRVDYELTERARQLLPVVGELAKWGYRWAWGPPRPQERIDVGAILRAATGMDLEADLKGTLELVVEHPERGELRYVLHVEDGEIRYSEKPNGSEPGARVRGHQKAWIEVFGPDGSRASLEIDGDAGLAHALLDAIVEDAAPEPAEDDAGDDEVAAA